MVNCLIKFILGVGSKFDLYEIGDVILFSCAYFDLGDLPQVYNVKTPVLKE
jgi:hypothetical protein